MAFTIDNIGPAKFGTAQLGTPGGVVTWSLPGANTVGQHYTWTAALTGQLAADVQAAFAEWENFGNIRFVQVADGPDVDIRLGQVAIDGPFGQAGEAFFSYNFPGTPPLQGSIQWAEVKFDSQENWALNSFGRMQIPNGEVFLDVATHEIGHALGFNHHTADPSVMVPTGNNNVFDVQPYDIAAIRAIYGPAIPEPDDFNGNATSDILWRNADGSAVIWQLNNGRIQTPTSLGAPPPSWQVLETGDYNGDGTSDLLWRNSADNQTVIWLISNRQIQSAVPLGNIPAVWTPESGDFNNDGITDILWRNSGGPISLWLMNSGGSLQTPVGLGSLDASWHIAEVGDFNGDQTSDILWRNSSGLVVDWQMRNGAILNSPSFGTVDGTWRVSDTGDFNHDGVADILWRNTNGTTTIWFMNNGSIQSAASLGVVPTDWHVADAGDYNGDGTTDILWQNNNGTTVAWSIQNGAIAAALQFGALPTSWFVAEQHAELV